MTSFFTGKITPPFIYIWVIDEVSSGDHSIRASSHDDAGGSATSEVSVKIIHNVDAPLAAFHASNVAGQAALFTHFYDDSTNDPINWMWDFGDGTKLAAGSGIIRHTYVAGGAYNVKLTLNDTNYCNSPDSLIKQISLAPNVIANFTLPPAACAPFNASFRNTSLAGQSFFWDFGDGGTSTLTSPSHLYARPGTYAVQLIAVDANTCNKRDTIIKNLVVVNKPTAAYTYSPNPTRPNTPAQFTNT